MAYRIRRNDMVVVLAGKDRGKQGRVVRVIPRQKRIVVEGVNVITRHIGRRSGVRQTGLVQQEAPLDLSNVKIVCPSCEKPSRVGSRFLEDGTKVRICKACNEVLE